MAEARVVSWDNEGTVLIEVDVDRRALRALAIAGELRQLARELGSLGYGIQASNLASLAEDIEEGAIEDIKATAQASAEAALRQIAASQFNNGEG